MPDVKNTLTVNTIPVVLDGDARLTDERQPIAHAASHHASGDDALALGSIAGTLAAAQHGNLSGGTLHAAATTGAAGFTTLAVDGGTTAGTVVQATDARLTNSRTPLAHDIGGALHTGSLTDSLHGTRGGGTQHANVIAAGAAGFMSGADKTKLDGIATGATANTGTVTSVAITVPNILSVGGSPVTTSGTLAISLATQAANQVFAGPASGGNANPTFRALVATDVPGLPWSKITSGTPTTLAGYGITDAVGSNDARLTDARTPTAHATAHHSAGSDPLTLASIAGTLADSQLSANVPLLNAGNVWTVNQTIRTGTSSVLTLDGGPGNPVLAFDADAGVAAQFRFQTAGLLRWVFQKNAAAETGSNAGSNFAITRYGDGGGGIADALFIRRSNGQVGIANSNPAQQLDVTGNVHVSSRLGIGQATPTARLHLPAGTATANTAPIKLEAGTNLTTVENGTFEFNGTNLFFTASGVRRTISWT